MRGFAVIINDRGEDRCIAVFSQKYRARSFVQHLRTVDPVNDPRMMEVEIDGGLYIPFKDFVEKHRC